MNVGSRERTDDGHPGRQIRGQVGERHFGPVVYRNLPAVIFEMTAARRALLDEQLRAYAEKTEVV